MVKKKSKPKTTKPTPDEPKDVAPPKPKGQTIEVIYERVKEAERTGRGYPDSVSVVFHGMHDEGMRHKGRAHNPDGYLFTGNTPVIVTNPIDIEFFVTKAYRNPKLWAITKAAW